MLKLTETERTEAGLLTLTCRDCRTDTGMTPLHPNQVGPRAYYYCPRCGDQWCDTPNQPTDMYLVVTTILWMVVLFSGLVGILFLVTRGGITRYGRDYLESGHFMATVGVAGVCWVILAVLVSRVACWAASWLTRAVRFVWGR